MNPPDDIRSDLLWYRQQHARGFSAQAVPNPAAHEYPCHVYWGSHGCARPNGHEGDHWCDCCTCADHPNSSCVAGPPYYGPNTNFYGEDAPEPELSEA